MTKESTKVEENTSVGNDAKLPVVCSTCGDICDKNGFSPQGTEAWFCSQECCEEYFNELEEDSFQCCADCDLPDACSDFGCAIKAGIVKRRYW